MYGVWNDSILLVLGGYKKLTDVLSSDRLLNSHDLSLVFLLDSYGETCSWSRSGLKRVNSLRLRNNYQVVDFEVISFTAASSFVVVHSWYYCSVRCMHENIFNMATLLR